MFDISWGELVLIGMVALIVIGPKELPTVLRTLGQWMTKVRRMAAEFQGQFQEAMREAELAELKKQVDAIGDTARNLAPDFNPIETARKEIESAVEPKPTTASTPPDTSAPAVEPSTPPPSPEPASDSAGLSVSPSAGLSPDPAPAPSPATAPQPSAGANAEQAHALHVSAPAEPSASERAAAPAPEAGGGRAA